MNNRQGNFQNGRNFQDNSRGSWKGGNYQGQKQNFNSRFHNTNTRPNSMVTCFNCNEKGHIGPNCPKLQQNAQSQGGERGPRAITSNLN